MCEYAFEGQVIKLTDYGYQKWRKSYSRIPDLMAELQKADDYYTVHPPRDNRWFFPVSRWLANENAKYVSQSTVIDASDRLIETIRAFSGEAGIRGETGETPPRLLSDGECE